MVKTSLKVGQSAPDFSLLDQEGNWTCLEDLRGKWVILYFILEIIHQDAALRQRISVV